MMRVPASARFPGFQCAFLVTQLILCVPHPIDLFKAREHCKLQTLAILSVLGILITISTVADPLSMAPFLPGDFITFAGVRRGNEIICFSIVAQNVQITTLANLVYVRMELGLLGIDNFNGNVEIAESRVSTNFPAF